MSIKVYAHKHNFAHFENNRNFKFSMRHFYNKMTQMGGDKNSKGLLFKNLTLQDPSQNPTAFL